MNAKILNQPRYFPVACPYCGKMVAIEYGWIVTHREPDSSAACKASGTYIEGWVPEEVTA